MSTTYTATISLRSSVAEPCSSCGARPFSVCSAIDTADLDRLAAAAMVIRVEPGRSFVVEGDRADSFFNVTGGTARIFKSLPDGRRQIIGFAARGYFLGLAVVDSYAFGAEAIDAVQLCRFSRTRLRALLDDFPALERRLLEAASAEIVAGQEQMLLLGRKTARERLASFLLARAALCGCPPGSATVHLPMTRGDIADYLGLTIETVSRSFSRLKADGLIGIPNNSDVILLDRAALEAEAAQG